MTIEKELRARADNKCELCPATSELTVFAVPPASNESAAQSEAC